jgi:DNA-directed RNA polymerase specialized sigma24 family protein
MGPERTRDCGLIREVLAERPDAWKRFVARVSDKVWVACTLVTSTETETEAAFKDSMEALRADGFRRLRPYDGSSTLDTFITLLAREFLSERLIRLIGEPGDAGWKSFEAFFGVDIRRIIRRRLPAVDGDHLRQDCYQEICFALLSDGYRRIKAYQGAGSFTGFVLHTVDRLLIDYIRQEISGRSRTGEGDRSPMRTALPLEAAGDVAMDGPTPEDALLAAERERILSLAADVLRKSTASLNDAERLYVRIALGSGEPVPAREVARLMRRPVAEIYKLKQRVMANLRETMAEHPAVKTWRSSVL